MTSDDVSRSEGHLARDPGSFVSWRGGEAVIGQSGTSWPESGSASASGNPAFYRRHAKRWVDLVLGLAVFWLILPVIAVLAIVVSLDGSTPFFHQRRVGRGGRIFNCYKLRTMAIDAEVQLTHILNNDAMAEAEWSQFQKLGKDPRVTRVGRFLRKTGFDELPQIWNVLRGDMSLVGPRPVVPAEIARYGVHAPHYLALRPGISGLWQISDRHRQTYEQRVQMDVAYDRQLTFLGDLSIMLATPKTVLQSRGQ